MCAIITNAHFNQVIQDKYIPTMNKLNKLIDHVQCHFISSIENLSTKLKEYEKKIIH